MYVLFICRSLFIAEEKEGVIELDRYLSSAVLLVTRESTEHYNWKVYEKHVLEYLNVSIWRNEITEWIAITEFIVRNRDSILVEFQRIMG